MNIQSLIGTGKSWVGVGGGGIASFSLQFQ